MQSGHMPTEKRGARSNANTKKEAPKQTDRQNTLTHSDAATLGIAHCTARKAHLSKNKELRPLFCVFSRLDAHSDAAARLVNRQQGGLKSLVLQRDDHVMDGGHLQAAAKRVVERVGVAPPVKAALGVVRKIALDRLREEHDNVVRLGPLNVPAVLHVLQPHCVVVLARLRQSQRSRNGHHSPDCIHETSHESSTPPLHCSRKQSARTRIPSPPSPARLARRPESTFFAGSAKVSRRQTQPPQHLPPHLNLLEIVGKVLSARIDGVGRSQNRQSRSGAVVVALAQVRRRQLGAVIPKVNRRLAVLGRHCKVRRHVGVEQGVKLARLLDHSRVHHRVQRARIQVHLSRHA